ncbi:NAD(P)/FAD-dependent oxidoreductase [Nakamurella leprariae]|uniref:FAD-dependent oxidoreductase n=1 Tax=Nakamurella leprariae TaxID=2803911 RepID=A0A938YFU1_9ACTN|nr:NAD(P)/FAD-dependent oxidoreductase [Nakamurella leprariae]MBM9469114.1 FAD-dependent oxidoreductase [Nakamurella leprariae]
MASTTAYDHVHLLVIGGGPAGHSAVAGYRDDDGPGRVLLVSDDQAQPYNRPPLSKDYLRGETDEAELWLDGRGYYEEHDIELWLDDPVVSLDAGARVARTASGRSVAYEQCVLATGCRPAVLPIPGGGHPDVLQLRFLDQAQELRGRAERAASAVVVGSGFIGCEAAMSLALRGLAVTMVSSEPLPQRHRLGQAAAERIATWLADAGVHLIGDAHVAAIEDGRAVHLEDGRSVTADLVLTAVGVDPQTQLAADAGCTLDGDRVVVDEHLATGIPGLFAAGDIAFARNATAGRHLAVEHWGEATIMGEIAGENAAGATEAWGDVPGFWSEIGPHTLKYGAWGDGWDRDVLVEHPDGGWTVWYTRDQDGQQVTVGVLTSEADADYDHGCELVAAGAPLPALG